MKDPEPLEQIDYGFGYKATHSPQQHTSVKVEADRAYAVIAMILSVGAILCVIVTLLVLPAYIKSEANSAAVHAAQPLGERIASMQTTMQYTEREARLAIQDVIDMKAELAKGK